MRRRLGNGISRRRIGAGALVASLVLALFPAVFDAGAAPADSPCKPTPEDSEGPFYRPGAPERTSTGEGLIVSGRLLGAPGCRPLPGGRIEWWHAAPSGEYDDAHRGSTKTGPDGKFGFSTDFPGKYPWRPLHIHFKADAPGYRPLTTQLYLRRGEKRVEFPIVLVPR